MSTFKSKMRAQSESWLLEQRNVKLMTDGLFVTLTFPEGSITSYKYDKGRNDLSNRDTCVLMLRNLKNRIKNRFYGRENWRGWFIPVIEENGK